MFASEYDQWIHHDHHDQGTQKKLNFRRWLVRDYDEVKGFEKKKDLGKYVDPLNLP